MNLRFRQLRLAERFESDPNSSGFDVVLGGGQSIASCRPGGTSLWLPLRGELSVQGAEGWLHLRSGQLLMWTAEELRGSTGRHGLWLMLSATADAWNRALLSVLPTGRIGREPVLYPGLRRADRGLRHLLFQLLRSARTHNSGVSTSWLLEAALLALWESQRPLEELVQRCPGRSYQRRQQTLLRLLRVRNRVQMRPTERTELAELASIANYSPWHFTRAFHEVFGETPCEYANRVRLEYAHRLVREDQLTVTEIAGMIGYDSRSAFCRSFRHAFGMTASQVRCTAA